MRKSPTVIAMLAAVSLLAGGCASSTLEDLEGVEAEHPDTVRVFQNANGFPNVNIVCVREGDVVIGLLNTTRDYQQTHVLEDAETAAFCDGANVPE